MCWTYRPIPDASQPIIYFWNHAPPRQINLIFSQMSSPFLFCLGCFPRPAVHDPAQQAQIDCPLYSLLHASSFLGWLPLSRQDIFHLHCMSFMRCLRMIETEQLQAPLIFAEACSEV